MNFDEQPNCHDFPMPIRADCVDSSSFYIACLLGNFLFVCVVFLQPSQHNGVMSSAIRLPNYTFTGQA